jgi:hypothetical protein
MFSRKCPICNNDVFHTSKYNRNSAIIKNRPCKKCSATEVSNRPEHVKRMELNNPGKGVWEGRKHKKQSIEKMKSSAKDNREYTKTAEFKEKISKVTSGKNNGMYGRSFYDIWLEKYGKKEADKRLNQFKEKQSLNNRGFNNSMYGKPSPHGSGNGWSGWYKAFYFRSLHELHFLIIAERFKLKLKTAEEKLNAIKYIDWDNIERNYFADYIVNDKWLVEVKPKRLWNTPKNKLKFEAAKKWCNNKGLKFKLIDFGKPNDILKNKNVEFTKNYQEKLLNCEKNKYI